MNSFFRLVALGAVASLVAACGSDPDLKDTRPRDAGDIDVVTIDGEPPEVLDEDTGTDEDAVVEETAPEADSGAADDTLVPPVDTGTDTFVADTFVPPVDTGTDTFVADTFVPPTDSGTDTFVPDTFIPPDTFVPDTFVPDTFIPPDTFAPDTFIPPDTFAPPPDTAVDDTSVIDLETGVAKTDALTSIDGDGI